ncbi:hypothetical protein ACFVVM_24200 [Nocardia sp. NPDC058176]
MTAPLACAGRALSGNFTVCVDGTARLGSVDCRLRDPLGRSLLR